MFNENRRVVGFASNVAGSRGCQAYGIDFPKLSTIWTHKGQDDKRLKDFLSPNSGRQTLPPVAGYDLDVAGETFTNPSTDLASGFFRTAGRIDVKDVTVESDGRLILRAREGIRIEEPFHAKAGSEFEMRIDDGPHLSDLSFPSASSSTRASTSNTSGSASQKTASNSSGSEKEDQSTSATQQTEAGLTTKRPEEFALHAPHPNPSSGQVTVRYALPEAAHVEMALFDMLGRRVQELASESQSARSHRLTFDTAGLSSGTYFIRLRAGDFTETQAVTLVK